MTISSLNRERDVKRKKTRGKSAKKGNEIKHPHQLQSEPSPQLNTNLNPNINNTVCLKKEGWSKVSENICKNFLQTSNKDIY